MHHVTAAADVQFDQPVTSNLVEYRVSGACGIAEIGDDLRTNPQ
jgi:hypothetical protein